MARQNGGGFLARLLSGYGMLPVLLLLCAFFSYATRAVQYPDGAAGGERVARVVVEEAGPGTRVLVVAGDTKEDTAFAEAAARDLGAAGVAVVRTTKGKPGEVKD